MSFQPAIVELNLLRYHVFHKAVRDFMRLTRSGDAGQAMAHQDPSSPTSGRAGVRYGLAVLSVASALACALFLRDFDLEIALFLIAIALTAWYAGIGPGYLAIVLSMASLAYFFIPPLYSVQIDLVHLPRCILFTLIAVAINGLSALRRRTEQELRQTQNELETKVNERTAELRMASAELETILEASPVGIMLFSRDHAIQRCNAACVHILGWRTDEIIGQFVPIAEHRRTEWQAYIERLEQGKAFFSLETQLIRKDGSGFDASISGAPLPRETGVTIGSVATVVDITERKRVEAALRERANLLNLTHDTIFVRDMNDVITYWNRGAEELYGWSAEQALGKVTHHLMQTVFPAPIAQIQAELRSAGRWAGELVHTKADGTQVMVASRWSLQRDERNQPVAILETNNDITKRKQAEAELRESEQKYRYIFNSTGVSIWQEDFSQVKIAVDNLKCEGIRDLAQYFSAHPEFVERAIEMVKVVDVNEATIELFEARDKDELLRSLHRVFTPETRDVFAKELIVLAEGGTRFESQTVLKTLNGKRISVIFTIAIPTESTRFDRVLVSITDITEQKRVEEALRQAQADLAHVSRVSAMSGLTASLAHEINQPIAAAVTDANTCMRWLARDEPDIAEARDAASRMIKDVTRAADIISRLRALFKKGAPQRELVDLNEVIQEMILLLRNEATRYSISIRTDLSYHLPQVMADRVQLQQVFLNLMLNSIDAMKDIETARELTIRAQKAEDGQLLISVSDTGLGLPPERADQIFNAFFTTKTHGIGMGLPISRSIVESHDGRLWAASNSGRGAIFYMTLPAIAEALNERG